jgi:Spy/CpxP family protein refolding chaperone
MKKTILVSITACLLAAGALAASARAEEGGKDGARKEHAGKMLKERLGLSDDQADKLKAAWDAQKAAMKPLREAAKEGRRKLEEQVRGLASDKEIQATLDALDANRKAMLAERQKVEATLASVLKPSQRAKLRLMMARRMMKGRGRKAEGNWGARRGKAGRACGGNGRRGDDD